jgi:hypothetical protein
MTDSSRAGTNALGGAMSASTTVTLGEVKEVLHDLGYRWHSFGERTHERDGQTFYWFNGSMFGEGPGRLTKQPFGWFTLGDMLAEKFAEGCR